MSKHILLYLTADGLRWYASENGQPVLEARFPGDEDGIARFASRLAAQSARTQYSVLVDVPDEGFNAEFVPAIRGRDRRAMIQRKLAQQFYGSPYAAALSLGREKEGRRDERMLFAALTRPTQIDPWIAALTAARVRVRGVHSAPFVLDSVMARAQLPAGAYLLVNYTPAGIRQTYFHGGRLRFSRLSGGHDLRFADQLQLSAEEIRKTLAYLSAQRLTRRGELLPVVAMVSAKQFDAMRECVARSGDSPVSIAELGELRGAYGAPPPSGSDPDSLPLLLDALAAEGQCTQIGGAEVLRFQHIHQVRTALYLAAAAVVMAGSLIAAVGLYETASLRTDTEQLRRLATSEQQRYRRLIDSLPELPAPVDDLRALIAGFDGFARTEIPPVAVYRALSQVLDQNPEIRLERLEWRRRDSPAPAPESVLVATATLGLPSEMASDQRAMFEISERIAADVARVVGKPPKMIRRPVNLQSTQTLRGREGGGPDDKAKTPSFELEFELRAGQRT